VVVFWSLERSHLTVSGTAAAVDQAKEVAVNPDMVVAVEQAADMAAWVPIPAAAPLTAQGGPMEALHSRTPLGQVGVRDQLGKIRPISPLH